MPAGATRQAYTPPGFEPPCSPREVARPCSPRELCLEAPARSTRRAYSQPGWCMAAALVCLIVVPVLLCLAYVSSLSTDVTRSNSRSSQQRPALRQATTTSPGAQGIPVFLMHGLEDYIESFGPMQRWIKEARPGTLTIPVPLYENRSSFVDLHTQVSGLTNFIRSAIAADPVKFKDGYDLVCFSQGGLVCRATVQNMDDHRVQTLISLAGPQQGVFGHSMYWWKHMTTMPSTMKVDGKTEVFYWSVMQQTCSVANMWHDPTNEEGFLSSNVFLPLYNGLTDDPGNARRKANFVRLSKAVFTAGGLPGEDGDGIVEPARSAAFDFYRTGSTSEYVTMREQPFYVNDAFGLRTLDEQDKLLVHVKPGVRHGEWMLSKRLVADFVLPYLTPKPPKQWAPDLQADAV